MGILSRIETILRYGKATTSTKKNTIDELFEMPYEESYYALQEKEFQSYLKEVRTFR